MSRIFLSPEFEADKFCCAQSYHIGRTTFFEKGYICKTPCRTNEYWKFTTEEAKNQPTTSKGWTSSYT